MTTIYPTLLTQLGVLSLSGPDARSFLQGQVTADLDSLTPDNVVLAACNSPQGRVQAVLWMLERSDGFALLVTRPVLERTLMRLRRYVLRSKVTIEADRLSVGLLDPSGLPAPLEGDRVHRQIADASLLRLTAQGHVLVVAPPTAMTDAVAVQELIWHREYLQAGLPQIYPQTHEQFVAQMLNLDLLGGISFEKGCYTGQEIIARTHFRGAIKRRMFRYRASCPPPAPATRLLVNGGEHSGDVVDSVAVQEGCELLAVVSLSYADEPVELETNPGVPLRRLDLPYEARDGVTG
jgi:tRNA-modifying protein YgfZ